MTTYDVHAHCVPEDLIDEVRRRAAPLATEVVDAGRGPCIRFAGCTPTRPVRADLLDVDARLTAMDQASIDVQLVSSWIDLTGYGLPRRAAVRWSQTFNEALAGVVARHPERLLGLCTVPLRYPEDAAEELRRAVADAGFVGAQIATTVEDVPLGDPGLDPFWAAAADLRCPILVHPSFVPAAGGHLDLLENVVGRPAATTSAFAHMVFGGVMERFPDLQLISVHGGGFIPWQAARWDHGYQAIAATSAGSLTRAPTASLRNVYFDTVLFDPKVVGYLVDWAGADRVVLGTDYPFPMGDLSPLDTLDAVAGLSDDARTAITSDNVERLLASIRR